MLKTVDCNSLNELMFKVLPDSIFDKNSLVYEGKTLDSPVSES